MMFEHSLTEKSVASLVALSVTTALLALIDVGTTAEQPLMRLERVLIVGKSSAQQPSQQLAQLACAETAQC
ncbi:hypothetical protein OOZ63_09205 [Paucibacter sp. PLA-PC-4]|uniref:hypothetical protein n=1 Tax=Paucibacter sp. PLA-PC-4 TaxID=2993655 RepID=UPI0022496B21|nr:hypothetical protein [Paucibacter sp. PLA-PC-4]MCX2862016.1 hypothetical protein [Paucibacter sp. PLA-PC-4]